MDLKEIVNEYGFENSATATALGSGHINKTYLVEGQDNRKGVLQKINTEVFKIPEVMMSNLQVIVNHLANTDYPYKSFEVVPTKSGLAYIGADSGFWRMLSFLDGTEASVGKGSAQKAEVVSRGYGCFLTTVNKLKVEMIQEVIPDFHNPEIRFQQLLEAADSARKERLENAQSQIDHAIAFSSLCMEYSKCCESLPRRITHGDAKASNILVDPAGQNIVGVIDLDTVMPGYLMNDFGDMVRSNCNTSKEDEKDIDSVNLDIHNFSGIATGFLKTIHEILTQEELDSLLTGVKSILYEQFIRFLTDYLNNDSYYGAKYSQHNLIRARVHLKLLIDYQTNEDQLIEILNSCLHKLYS